MNNGNQEKELVLGKNTLGCVCAKDVDIEYGFVLRLQQLSGRKNEKALNEDDFILWYR